MTVTLLSFPLQTDRSASVQPAVLMPLLTLTKITSAPAEDLQIYLGTYKMSVKCQKQLVMHCPPYGRDVLF